MSAYNPRQHTVDCLGFLPKNSPLRIFLYASCPRQNSMVPDKPAGHFMPPEAENLIRKKPPLSSKGGLCAIFMCPPVIRLSCNQNRSALPLHTDTSIKDPYV